ncbi:MAG: NifU family protein [Bdellovibrionales bacterium]|nr:NifU family protein [Bdellovibrionales bacterium]
MNQEPQITISVEPTPNPQSMKFTISRNITEETWETEDITKAGRSPLAQKILGFPWASKVFIGSNFITISKENWVEWEVLVDPLSQMIKEHIESEQAILHPPVSEEEQNNKMESPNNISSTDSQTVQKIKQILKTDIQPAVSMDGGFITFAGYEKGTVFLKMQGACSGCPSSSITLKQGIETHLKNQIPEVQQVVAL